MFRQRAADQLSVHACMDEVFSVWLGSKSSTGTGKYSFQLTNQPRGQRLRELDFTVVQLYRQALYLCIAADTSKAPMQHTGMSESFPCSQAMRRNNYIRRIRWLLHAGLSHTCLRVWPLWINTYMNCKVKQRMLATECKKWFNPHMFSWAKYPYNDHRFLPLISDTMICRILQVIIE